MIRTIAFRVFQALLIRKRNSIISTHLPGQAKKIVDVGCGHFPNKFATHAVDSPAENDVQRGGLKLADDRPGVSFSSVDLNVFPYPFADKEFDYLICTHVLEHLDDPVRACQEFSRIAKAGYLEVPYLGADVFVRNNDAIHKWLCLPGGPGSSFAFLRRAPFIAAYPPAPISLAARFLVQLGNLSCTWTDSVAANYVEITAAADAKVRTTS